MRPESRSRLSSVRPQALRLPAIALGLLAGLASSAQAQVAWVSLSTPKAPPARSRAGMAYDFLRQRIVLFGGQGAQYKLNDTWEFDGTAWKQIVTAKSPPARSDFAMTYDRSRGVVVLNGGYVSGGMSNGDTWEYDGVNWTERQLTAKPPDLATHAMVYDAGTGNILLFGGFKYNGVSDETWIYNGYYWTQLTPTVSPSGRQQPVLVHDPIRNRIVMHGGTTSGYPQFDTYEFNGTTWSLTTRAPTNPGRDLPAYCFDNYRGRLVLFGGLAQNWMQDTYEYENAKWALRTLVGPPARMGAAMAYDSVRRECIMFGGETNYGQNFFGDTYRFTSLQPANATKFGAGCAGTWSTPALSTYGYDLPYIGSTMRLYLTALPADRPALLWLGASKTTFGPIALPFSLVAVGMPGCSLLASPAVFLSVPTSGHYGTLPVPVPTDPSLVGGTLFAQALIIDPGANAGNAIVTQGLDLKFGQK